MYYLYNIYYPTILVPFYINNRLHLLQYYPTIHGYFYSNNNNNSIYLLLHLLPYYTWGCFSKQQRQHILSGIIYYPTIGMVVLCYLSITYIIQQQCLINTWCCGVCVVVVCVFLLLYYDDNMYYFDVLSLLSVNSLHLAFFCFFFTLSFVHCLTAK